jgi:predicted nucleic acid-binding protein
LIVLTDSSVWIDFFRGKPSIQTRRLRELLSAGQVLLCDLVLVELLQGTDSERDFRRVHSTLTPFPMIDIGGRAIAVQAARHYRALRERGITVRKTIDTLIATRCIADGIPLLYSDRDFDPFVTHCGLVSAAE